MFPPGRRESREKCMPLPIALPAEETNICDMEVSATTALVEANRSPQLSMARRLSAEEIDCRLLGSVDGVMHRIASADKEMKDAGVYIGRCEGFRCSESVHESDISLDISETASEASSDDDTGPLTLDESCYSVGESDIVESDIAELLEGMMCESKDEESRLSRLENELRAKQQLLDDKTAMVAKQSVQISGMKLSLEYEESANDNLAQMVSSLTLVLELAKVKEDAREAEKEEMIANMSDLQDKNEKLSADLDTSQSKQECTEEMERLACKNAMMSSELSALKAKYENAIVNSREKDIRIDDLRRMMQASSTKSSKCLAKAEADKSSLTQQVATASQKEKVMEQLLQTRQGEIDRLKARQDLDCAYFEEKTGEMEAENTWLKEQQETDRMKGRRMDSERAMIDAEYLALKERQKLDRESFKQERIRMAEQHQLELQKMENEAWSYKAKLTPRCA